MVGITNIPKQLNHYVNRKCKDKQKRGLKYVVSFMRKETFCQIEELMKKVRKETDEGSINTILFRCLTCCVQVYSIDKTSKSPLEPRLASKKFEKCIPIIYISLENIHRWGFFEQLMQIVFIMTIERNIAAETILYLGRKESLPFVYYQQRPRGKTHAAARQSHPYCYDWRLALHYLRSAVSQQWCSFTAVDVVYDT